MSSLVLRPGLAALVLLTAAIAAAPAVEPRWPMPAWPKATPSEAGMDAGQLDKARRYALRGGGSGYVTRGGRLVMQWGDPRRRYDLKSTTKSIGITALGLALGDGKIKSLSDLAARYHPSLANPPAGNASTGWPPRITLFHLATQTAGFGKSGGYTKLGFAPGTRWQYSDGGPNWLAECVTLVYKRDLRELLFERVFTPIGIQRSDLTWRNNAYRKRTLDGIPRRELGSGISANVDAMARIGTLYLRGGQWQGRQLIPKAFVDQCRVVPAALRGLPVVDEKRYGKAASHYGLLWWNNADGTLEDVPRDAYWSWGLYDSLIVVIPSLDVVVARAGRSFQGDWGGHYDKLAPFLGPIAASVGRRRRGARSQEEGR